jgi:hypothetical protein
VLGLKRKRKAPADLRARFARDERAVAIASTVDSSGVVAVTTRGLWLPGQDRLGWNQIHKATWAGGRLTVVAASPVSERETYTVMSDAEAVVVALTDPQDVPAEVRTRVTRSVAYTAHHPVPGGGVRVVARRVPGVDGVTWTVRYDEGIDIADPDVIARTDELVAEASAPRPD